MNQAIREMKEYIDLRDNGVPEEDALVATVTYECDICGDRFKGWQYGDYTAEERGVCPDCTGELDPDVREEYRERKIRMREERLEV